MAIEVLFDVGVSCCTIRQTIWAAKQVSACTMQIRKLRRPNTEKESCAGSATYTGLEMMRQTRNWVIPMVSSENMGIDQILTLTIDSDNPDSVAITPRPVHRNSYH